MNPQVSIDRILTLQSYFIEVGSVSEPGPHQSISRIPAGECGQSTSPQSARIAGFVLPAIGLQSNKTVTWHPIPDVPAAAVLAMLSGPTGSTTGGLHSVPAGLLAVIGSFLLFGLGTLAALTKHRWNRTD